MELDQQETKEINSIQETEPIEKHLKQSPLVETAKEEEDTKLLTLSGTQKEQKFQAYISDIPRGTTEEMLKESLEKYVKIKELTISKNKKTGESKGYGFATLYTKEDLYALVDLQKTPVFVDNITHHKFAIKISIADPKNCLYISKIPKTASQLEIEKCLLKFAQIEFEKFELSTTSTLESKGFGWVTYPTHEIALIAFKNLKSKLIIDNVKIQVSFAQPRIIDERLIDNVKVLYVKNLPDTIQELQMIQLFGGMDLIEKTIIPFDKTTFKPQGHAFVHYKERKDAVKYLNEMNGYTIDGNKIVVEMSIPQSIVKSKKQSNEKKSKKEKKEKQVPQQPMVVTQFLPFFMPYPVHFQPQMNPFGGFVNPTIPMTPQQLQQHQQQLLQHQQELYKYMYQMQEKPKEKKNMKKYNPY